MTGRKDRLLYRFFEVLPGVLAWGTLAAIFIFSFLAPFWMAVFIIIFDVYWLIKTVYLSLHLRLAFSRLRRNLKINWLEKLQKLKLEPDRNLPGVSSWRDVYHLVMFPMYKESYETVEASIESLVRANYPRDKMMVVLAQEERAGREFNKSVSDRILSKYKNKFLDFLVIEHPAGVPGELPGKGSNMAHAGRWIKENYIDRLDIPYERVMVSAFDIDTIAPPEYFARLAYVYLTADNPLRSFYQPVPFYTNNIWEAPAFARVVAFSGTFWHTIKQNTVDADTSFSSHSIPFKVLADIDFWQHNMVSEDSRVYWQAYFRYDGNYEGKALFYPVSMDANVAPTFWQTMANVYKQQRRWGYGVDNISYMLFAFSKNKAIPFWRKLKVSVRMLERFWSWATNALIIFLLGWLPIALGGTEFNRTVLSYNLPFVTRTIMTLAMLGLVTSAILTIFILPPRPPNFGRHRHILMVLQWILMPLTMIFLGAVPGLDAQTRLMLGRYMGFWVTPKGSPKVDDSHASPARSLS